MKNRIVAILCGVFVVSFTGYMLADTFVISRVYETNAGVYSDSDFQQALSRMENDGENGDSAEGTEDAAAAGTTEDSAAAENGDAADTQKDKGTAHAGKAGRGGRTPGSQSGESGDGDSSNTGGSSFGGRHGGERIHGGENPDRGGKTTGSGAQKGSKTTEKSTGSSAGKNKSSSGSKNSGSSKSSGSRSKSSGSTSSSGSSKSSGSTSSSDSSKSSGSSTSSSGSSSKSSGSSTSSSGSSTESTGTETKSTESAGTQTQETKKENGYTVTVTEKRVDDTQIYVADIKLDSAEHFKTAFANQTYGKNVTAKTSQIAAQNNALLAINGDYYGAQEKGYVIRNGKVYRDTQGNTTQVCCIYADGTMKIQDSTKYSAQDLVNQGVWQAFSFGPALVENGKVAVSEGQEVGKAMASNPRTAIGMISANHYVFVVSDGRTSESVGLSLKQLAEVMKDLGVKTAYNMDGGGSSTMYYNGQVINNPTTSGRSIKERGVSDIVYIG